MNPCSESIKLFITIMLRLKDKNFDNLPKSDGLTTREHESISKMAGLGERSWMEAPTLYERLGVHTTNVK